MFPHRVFLGIAALAFSGTALAQVTIFRCTDETGRNHYTNVKEEMSGKKCAVVSREVSVVPVLPAPAAAPARSTASAPRVADAAPGAGRAREDNRRRILQEELESEQKRLSEAKQKLSEQQPRSNEPGGVLERIKPFAEAVLQAEKNVAQLQRELGNLK